ncbi:ubiquinol-cytochrome c reductase iron-sulfur subunit [Aquisalimonas asiatica]|uniref:Ubiquinol-cytochrome c reductase iron-sulfur subunit n=1 Tax=Aquisalimonas asiatica TaxID=406100 RepID=A0A1H8T0N8_9GAMM|nr:ubiquinol-cytochrome c reductase iron-sulfur subunit [Aquisalimonas asiatica]SEO84501.1 ubiquinol-cytochrome c reductase iron-sulfur subunit [Aquisalimonas asiatica]
MTMNRRRFLVAATTVVGGAGALTAAVPFIRYWTPSARARAIAAPVEINLEGLEPGQQINVDWRGQPVWVLRRTPEMLQRLDALTDSDELRDPHAEVKAQQPSYISGAQRAVKDEYLVVVALCTHLGCVPLFRPEPGSISADWPGGYFCPCHASMFDFAGRVFRGVPASTNLVIPPHRYLSESRIEIGADPE